MSLATNLQDFATRVATEFRTIRALVTGTSTGDLSGLTTTTKASIVAAINELDQAVDAAAASGGATNLDGLTDVTLSSPAEGHLLRRDALGQFVNVLGTDYFEPAGAAAAAQAAAEGASQPRDADLTAIAALATTAYGRGLLTLADLNALLAAIGTASTTVVGVTRLATVAETTTGTAGDIAATPAGVAAAVAAIVDAAPGTLDTLNELAAALGDDPNFATTVSNQIAGKQNADDTLTALAGLTTAANQLIYATGPDAFAMATLTSFGRSLIDDVDAAAARTTLDVYSKTEIGDPNTDFVTTFTTALTA